MCLAANRASKIPFETIASEVATYLAVVDMVNLHINVSKL